MCPADHTCGLTTFLMRYPRAQVIDFYLHSFCRYDFTRQRYIDIVRDIPRSSPATKFLRWLSTLQHSAPIRSYILHQLTLLAVIRHHLVPHICRSSPLAPEAFNPELLQPRTLQSNPSRLHSSLKHCKHVIARPKRPQKWLHRQSRPQNCPCWFTHLLSLRHFRHPLHRPPRFPHVTAARTRQHAAGYWAIRRWSRFSIEEMCWARA